MNNQLKKFSKAFSIIAIALCFVTACQAQSRNIEQWGVYEITLKGPSAGNPYMDNSIDAKFTNGSKTVTMPGFYDGEGVYKIRFSPDKIGRWTYITESNITELNKRSDSFQCVKPSGNNHGPVKIVNTYYFDYADGSPFYSVGTTAYQWTSVKQSIQEQTIKTLAKSPFNKVRMCVFPKSYNYGNNTEPWVYPYDRKDNVNDFTRPNFEFFQNFDKRVMQLMGMGIQADVILFHPYDKWGYIEMGDKMNAKYVRYMIARLSAYRNVWWSLANEWDIPKIKGFDWEGIGNILQKEDPSQHPRSIHNWYHDESHFYDPTRPWITHVSAQTYFFFNAIKWREKYQKPILFDEMRYEGDVPSNWGRLTAKEMTDYFWKAGLSGVYGMHSDTYKNDSDTETEVRWWAKGGTLMGQSSERIAFFKHIMEQAPVKEMTPKLVNLSGQSFPENIPDKFDGDLLEKYNNNIYTLYKNGDYYLSYTTDPGRTIELNLGGKKDYKLEVIDTWNMKTVSEKVVHPGKFEYKTEMPFTALRLVQNGR